MAIEKNAGIIAAHPNNGVGIAGAAPGVKIMTIRVLDANGSGSSSDVAQGIIWAVDHGARVINVSLGGGPSPGMRVAIQYALAHQVVTFAAAGNSYQNGNTPTYPAAIDGVNAVTALGAPGQIASYANYGGFIAIALPGSSVIFLGGVPYGVQGTSVSTAYATGIAAGGKSSSSLTWDQVLAAMRQKFPVPAK